MMTRMPNLRDSIARKIEMLPISNVKRDMAQADFAAAEESLDRVARLVEWLTSVVASTRHDAHLCGRHPGWDDPVPAGVIGCRDIRGEKFQGGDQG